MKRISIFEAEVARAIREERNGDCWKQHALSKINDAIKVAAQQGLSEISVSFNDLVKGAETLSEAAEMLQDIEKSLETAGYYIEVDLDTCLVYIIW